MRVIDRDHLPGAPDTYTFVYDGINEQGEYP